MILNAIAWLNKQDLRILIFAVLMLRYAGFELSDNEENYLQLSMQFINPEWIPNSTALTEFAGTRVLYQYLCGAMLLLFDFEWTAMLGRTLMAIGYAFALNHFFKAFKLPNLLILAILEGFMLTPQSLFAGEWYFLDFEAKVIGYVLAFAGLGEFFRQRWQTAIYWLVGATYFHILAGGWIFAACMIYLAIQGEWKAGLVNGVRYALLSLPLVGYLAYHVLLNPAATSPTGVSADWIYVYYRNSHHLGIGQSLAYFLKYPLWGVIFSVAFFYTALRLRTRLPHNLLKQVNTLTLAALSIPLLFVVVSFIDVEGKVMKFYPFRLSALSLFLIFTEAGLLLLHWLQTSKNSQAIAWVNRVLLLFGIITLLVTGVKHVYKEWDYASTWGKRDFNLMTYFIRDNTPTDAVFLYTHLAPKKDRIDGYTAFNRETRRDCFAVRKFVPAGTEKLFTWYARMLEKEKVRKDLNAVFDTKTRYRIDYLVLDIPFEHPKAKEVYKNNTFHVYRLE